MTSQSSLAIVLAIMGDFAVFAVSCQSFVPECYRTVLGLNTVSPERLIRPYFIFSNDRN